MTFTAAALRRIEEISQNASRPERGAMIDGWSVGLSPSKAKRSRCVNAFYKSERDFVTNLRDTKALYERAKLPCVFRLTPYVYDATLDARLQSMDCDLFDTTCVQTMSLIERFERGDDDKSQFFDYPVKTTFRPNEIGVLVKELRGDSDEEINALVARWHLLPQALTSFTAINASSGSPAAHVLTLREGNVVGIFDVVTAERERGKGLATHLLRAALNAAVNDGAEIAYLQVVETNPARRVYERLGFETAYHYWYREVSEA